MLAKASALLNSNDPDPDRHLSDIVVLAGIATRAELLEPLRPRQARRVLEATDRVEGRTIEIERLRVAMDRASRS